MCLPNREDACFLTPLPSYKAVLSLSSFFLFFLMIFLSMSHDMSNTWDRKVNTGLSNVNWVNR